MPRQRQITSRAANLLLSAIEKAAEGYIYLEDCYRHPSRVFYEDYRLPRSSLRSTVYRLSSKGLLEKEENENRIILKLTDAGRDWIVKHGSGEKWDGLWRLVLFDIPETHRKVRGILRSKLKSWGFIQWQKSVWAGRKPLTTELRKLVHELGVSEWVLVVESSNTGK